MPSPEATTSEDGRPPSAVTGEIANPTAQHSRHTANRRTLALISRPPRDVVISPRP